MPRMIVTVGHLLVRLSQPFLEFPLAQVYSLSAKCGTIESHLGAFNLTICAVEDEAFLGTNFIRLRGLWSCCSSTLLRT